MPSGAKKRKAAKKKLQKETKNTTNDDGSHSLGNENANKSQDERESDTGEGERESSEERVAVEVSLGERNVSEEVKSEDNYNDVKVKADDRATKNRAHKESSSSSSSSDDDEVAVKKDKPKVDETSGENPVSVDERIPIEELVKQTQEKVETKVIQVVDEDESLLPESSGVISAAAHCGDSHVKDSETHKYVEEQPLVSTDPLPVRRTSWTNCCGLFEVFSGGANR